MLDLYSTTFCLYHLLYLSYKSFSLSLYITAKLDGVKTYMRMRRVPNHLQVKVIKWFDYLWLTQKCSDEERAVSCLPDKLKVCMQYIAWGKTQNINKSKTKFSIKFDCQFSLVYGTQSSFSEVVFIHHRGIVWRRKFSFLCFFILLISHTALAVELLQF